MVVWYKQLVPVITITALLGTGAVANAVSDVEQAVLIPGATVFKPINPQYPIVAKTYPLSGSTFTTMPTRRWSTTRRMRLIQTGPSWTA